MSSMRTRLTILQKVFLLVKFFFVSSSYVFSVQRDHFIFCRIVESQQMLTELGVNVISNLLFFIMPSSSFFTPLMFERPFWDWRDPFFDRLFAFLHRCWIVVKRIHCRSMFRVVPMAFCHALWFLILKFFSRESWRYVCKLRDPTPNRLIIFWVRSWAWFLFTPNQF